MQSKNNTTYDYAIIGLGASGLLLAYQLAMDSFFSNKKILLLDQQPKSENDRTWCFWDKKTSDFEKIIYKYWDHIQFTSSTFSKKIDLSPYRYKMIRGCDFYTFVLDRLHRNPIFTIRYEKVISTDTTPELVAIQTEQNRYQSRKAFSSVLFSSTYQRQTHFPVLYQHFLGFFVKTQSAIFDPSAATFMDFGVPQLGNTRFMYVLPFSKTEALVEYTLFSGKCLTESEYKNAIHRYLKVKGCTNFEIQDTEQGVIPMSCFPFWEASTRNLLYIGTAGGWTKASTGFTFWNALKKSSALVHFLKKQEVDLSKFYIKNRFWHYDLLLLDVLFEQNHLGEHLFSELFRKNSVTKILKFLDEETTILEDFQITTSLPWDVFLKASCKRMLKNFYCVSLRT